MKIKSNTMNIRELLLQKSEQLKNLIEDLFEYTEVNE